MEDSLRTGRRSTIGAAERRIACERLNLEIRLGIARGRIAPISRNLAEMVHPGKKRDDRDERRGPVDGPELREYLLRTALHFNLLCIAM